MLQKMKVHLGTTAALATMLVGNVARAVIKGGADAGGIEAPEGFSQNLGTTINTILSYVLGIAGLIAVVFIIVGGFRYLTSGGSKEGVTGAKNTLLYAIVGLIVIALAFALKVFVFKILGAEEAAQPF